MKNVELAELIETAVRGVPGVTDVFATAGAVARATGAVRSRARSLVTVEGRATVTRVTVSVGVGRAAPDVAADVGAAVRSALHNEPRASDATAVVVRVGRVNDA